MTVLLFAAIREAAGSSTHETQASTVAELIEELGRLHGEVMVQRLASASVMVDGVKVAPDDRGVDLRGASEVAVVPPFAGG